MKESEKGKFIVIEGIGGSGKTTQIKLVEKLLSDNNINIHITREPGGIESSEDIRNLIFVLRDKKLIGPEGQMVLFSAARMLWVKNVVKPHLIIGDNVVTDRCHTSTAAYQGYAEGWDLNKIKKISELVLDEYKPDAIILIDISAITAQKRKVDLDGDPFDKEGLDYQNRLIAGYRKMANENWGDIPWYTVNGEGKIDEVYKEIKQVLEKIFNTNLK